MQSKSIAVIDQGTTSSRSILFSSDGKILRKSQKALDLIYPHNGWVEQDPISLWQDTLATLRDVTEDDNTIAALGITNQRETTIIWDRKSGKPIYNAIVWQDRRTLEYCQSLEAKGLNAQVSSRTGLVLDPYFSATKISWILDNVEGARSRAERGELAFGTVDSWLLWNLTGGTVHATDVTNASRTLLYNIRTLQWDDFLLDIFNVPRSLLPEVKDNVAQFGVTTHPGIKTPLPVLGMAGDQQAALIGHQCFKPGMIKSTYGTGCFALMNIGSKFRLSDNRLLSTLAYKVGEETSYAMEGSIFVAGAAIQWLRDNLDFFNHSAESEQLAQSVETTNGVYFVPAFTGLGAPYWEANARGAIFGLTRNTNKAHITRAALEAQAYQTLDLMKAMEQDGQCRGEKIRIDGGMSDNRFFGQFLADMLDRTVEVPENSEMTALGACILAGIGAGLYEGLHSLPIRPVIMHRNTPQIAPDHRATLYAGWQRCVKAII